MARIANRMQEAVTRLAAVFKANASIVVNIDDATGLRLVTTIAATPGRTPYEILDGGVIVPYESHDFIIAVADLNGNVPASGWTITDCTNGPNGRKFIVSMPGKMNVYESFQGIAYKIHTKAVS